MRRLWGVVLILLLMTSAVDGVAQVRKPPAQQRRPVLQGEAKKRPGEQVDQSKSPKKELNERGGQRIPLRKRVVDQAEILLPEQERELEFRIGRFEMETRKHIAVLILQSLQNEKTEEILRRMYVKHKMAKVEVANSVVLIMVVGDRLGKIEVGAQLRDVLPQPRCNEIIRNMILPRFKQRQFYRGINAGLLAVMIAIKPEMKRVIEQSASLQRPMVPMSVEEQQETTPPTVVITQPGAARGMKLSSKEKTIVVRGTVTDEGGVYEVSVNGVEAQLTPAGEFSAQVKLGIGDNTVTVKAIDTKGNTAEQKLTITRETSAGTTGPGETKSGTTDTEPGSGKYYALVIGIDKYSGDWPLLSNAVHDANGVAELLTNIYKFDKVTTLLDQQASRTNIIKQFEWLTETVKNNDNVLIFYSGHGDYKKNLNKGYWVPFDAKTQSTSDYISNGDIQTFLSGIPSKHTLLVSDACFSGDIFRGMAETVKNDDMTRYYEEVGRRASRQAISSGGLEPVMDGGKDGHSVFTYYFLKTLKENTSLFLDAGQVYDAIKIPIANNSDQTPVFNAIKNTGDEGGQFVFRKQ